MKTFDEFLMECKLDMLKKQQNKIDQLEKENFELSVKLKEALKNPFSLAQIDGQDVTSRYTSNHLKILGS